MRSQSKKGSREYVRPPVDGLTRRDYLAALILQSFLINATPGTENWSKVLDNSIYLANAFIERLDQQP